jgi:hypothetical protein
MREAILLSTEERIYVVEPVEGGYFFNYTTKPYSVSGSRPVTSGRFFMPTDEALAFIARAQGGK